MHLGIDLWASAETNVYAPLDGIIHSFADNQGIGNYGPTIILEHSIDDVRFYTLYGHLSRLSLQDLYNGKKFNKGEKIGELGNYPENGDWPHISTFKSLQIYWVLRVIFPVFQNRRNVKSI